MRLTILTRRRAVSGVEASQFFAAQRAIIMEDLATNAHDRSLAGRVDPQIAPLVTFINTNFDKYVTTSSCSGRIALFHRGKAEDSVTDSPELQQASTRVAPPKNMEGSMDSRKDRKRGSFGRGTLFQSHDPLPDVAAAVHDQLVPALAEFWRWRQQFPLVTLCTARTELLQLRFEPMILHILCRDIDAASALLQCASEAAQGNSGIISCSRGTQEQRKITCCVTSPLSFDIPLLSEGTWLIPTPAATETGSSGGSSSFHSGPWLQLLTQAVTHANELFDENARRTQRFREELARREGPVTSRE